MRTVNIYGMGGCGINLAAKVEDSGAQATYAYFDTSSANLSKVKSSNTYLLPGIDGSGGNREKNAIEIAEHMPQFLLEYPMADFNIVIASSGGGTGSKAAMELIKQTPKDAITVVVMIGEDTAQMIPNTRATLSELDAIAHETGKPITLIFDQVTENHPRVAVDNSAFAHINSLLEVLSNRFDELDSEDIRNFFDYTRVPSLSEINPMLTRLFVTSKVGNLNLNDTISHLALAADHSVQITKPEVEYHKTGYGEFMYIVEGDLLNYVIDLDAVTHIFAEFDRLTEEKRKRTNSKVRRRGPLGR